MMNLVNLDEVRRFMVEELDLDERSNRLYLSARLSAEGQKQYPSLLRQAMISHDDTWLADQLRRGLLNEFETRNTARGQVSAKVAVTAPETLAEGEFNRFYARAVCRAAIEKGKPEVSVYRARASSSPRPASEAMLGRPLDPNALLNDLRTHPGMDTALHLPPGPNSGLSIRL